MARPGTARRGLARQGKARHGEARQGFYSEYQEVYKDFKLRI